MDAGGRRNSRSDPRQSASAVFSCARTTHRQCTSLLKVGAGQRQGGAAELKEEPRSSRRRTSESDAQNDTRHVLCKIMHSPLFSVHCIIPYEPDDAFIFGMWDRNHFFFK